MPSWDPTVQGKAPWLLHWPEGKSLKSPGELSPIMGENLLEMNPEDRARKGLFLGFQYPVEIPGVSIVNFMKTAINEQRKFRGLEPISASDFLKLMRDKKELVGLLPT